LTSSTSPAANVGLELAVAQEIVTHTIYGKPMSPGVQTLTVTRTLERGVQANVYQIGSQGGTVEGLPRGPDSANVPRRSSQFSVTWRDAALSIETRAETRTGDAVSFTEHDELWSIDAGGSLVIVATDRGSSEEPVTNRLVFRRG
jgi:hypothetical protein